MEEPTIKEVTTRRKVIQKKKKKKREGVKEVSDAPNPRGHFCTLFFFFLTVPMNSVHEQ